MGLAVVMQRTVLRAALLEVKKNVRLRSVEGFYVVMVVQAVEYRRSVVH